MVVVLNEREYAEDLLREDVTWRTSGHALHYIAKLYFSKGYQKEQVKEKIPYICDNVRSWMTFSSLIWMDITGFLTRI